MLHWLREKYLHQKCHQAPNINKFNVLMPSKNEKSIHVVATYLYHAFKFRRELIIVIHMHHTYAHGMVFNCIVFILCYGLEALNHNKSLVA